MPSPYENPVLNVCDVNEIGRQLLENSLMPLWMKGEIGTLTLARSGHVYLTLKDAKAQIRCVYFKGGDAVRALNLETGSRVEVFGILSIYVPGGEFQFKIQKIKPIGRGSLQQQFEEIKQRLAAEGLFAGERKHPLPVLPERIGVITSFDGAALHDFLQILNRRFPRLNIQIHPAAVQGEKAERELLHALAFFTSRKKAERPNCIILMRGGGSIEDLWAFNSEMLARAIVESPVPVISAVGHEIDYTIADFAADVRAPTPSAAAELLVRPLQNFEEELDRAELTLTRSAGHIRQLTRAHLEALNMRLNALHPRLKIQAEHATLEHLAQRLTFAARSTLQNKQAELHSVAEHIRLLDPRNILNRGYVYLTDAQSKLLPDTAAFDAAETVILHFKDGTRPLPGK